MKTVKFWMLAICSVLLMNACAPLKDPVVVKKASLDDYKYVYIPETADLTSSSGDTYGGEYGLYGYTKTKTVNPKDVIAGILMKNGYIILPEIKPELAKETMVVNYGEVGKRPRAFGYTIEVSIQFISAKTSELICSCSAEGQGETEADDIRQAISRALWSVFPQQ